MFWPSGCTAVGVMSAWWENFLPESFSQKSTVDVQLLVINKLHSYCCKERKPKGSSHLHPNVKSRPTFIVAASLSMSQATNRLKQQGKLGGRGASWCDTVIINGYFAFSLRHPLSNSVKLITPYLSHLLLQLYICVLEMCSKKMRMENYAPLVLHVPKHFLKKITVINLSRNSPPLVELEGSSLSSQVSQLIRTLSQMNPVHSYTSHY
jgi:hypothetical protein